MLYKNRRKVNHLTGTCLTIFEKKHLHRAFKVIGMDFLDSLRIL